VATEAEKPAPYEALPAAEPAGESGARAISPIERDMLFFAISWLPYGGRPDDEVWVNFGMTPDRFAECLRKLVERHRAHIHPLTAQRLLLIE
jgi:Protein of unknown function (DUF3263)